MRQIAFVLAVGLGLLRAEPVFADPATYILHTPGVV